MTGAGNVPWRTGKGCVIVRVRVTPKSSKDSVEGVEQTADGPAVRVRVRAAPTEGQANTAVRTALAEWLDVARSRIELTSGGQSRIKSFAVLATPPKHTHYLSKKLPRWKRSH
jgi:uncharacterized protein